MANASQSEDTAKRFEAYGFEVHRVNGQDMEAFLATFEKARRSNSGKPQFISAKTVIGEGIPEVAGTQKAHGEAGAKFVDAARKGLGLPENEHFFVSDEVKAFFAERKEERQSEHM